MKVKADGQLYASLEHLQRGKAMSPRERWSRMLSEA